MNLSVDLRNIAAFLLVLGCVVGKGMFLGAAIVLLIIFFIKHRNLLTDYVVYLKQEKRTIGFMLFFILTLFIAAAFSTNSDSIKEAGHYLERMLPFFIVLLCLVKNKNYEPYIAAGLIVGSFVICSELCYKYFALDMNRPRGMLGGPNTFGGTLIFLIPFLMLYWYRFWDNKKFKYSIGITLLMAVLAFAAIKSRGSLLGLAVSISLFPLVLYKAGKIKRNSLLAYFAVCIIGFAGVYSVFYDSFHRSYDYERVALRDISLHMFYDHPLAGVGMGNFTSRYIGNDYISPLAYQKHFLSHAHNIYFKFLSETGFIGISGFLVLIFYQLNILWKNIKANNKKKWYGAALFLSILGMLAHGWVDVSFSARYFAMTYWMLWGVTCYSCYNKSII